MDRRFVLLLALAATLLSSLAATPPADACTRLVYLGAHDDVITARSMDWKTDVATNLWIFPRGMARNGQAGPNSVTWTSKYGSVIASGCEIATTAGTGAAGRGAPRPGRGGPPRDGLGGRRRDRCGRGPRRMGWVGGRHRDGGRCGDRCRLRA